MESPKKILLIEDDHGIRSSLETILEIDGYVVLAKHCAQSARDHLEKSSEPELPHAILLDLVMPSHFDGYAFHEWYVASRFRRIPLLVMSASRIIDLGSPYISKPFNIDTLLSAVRMLIACPIVYLPVNPFGLDAGATLR